MSVLLEEEDAEIDYQWLQEFMLSHTSVATDSETFLKELASERFAHSSPWPKRHLALTHCPPPPPAPPTCTRHHRPQQAGGSQ